MSPCVSFARRLPEPAEARAQREVEMSSGIEGQPFAWVRARARLAPGVLVGSRPWIRRRFDHAWAPMQALAGMVACLPNGLWGFLLWCEGGYAVITKAQSGYRPGPAVIGDKTVENIAYLSIEDLAGPSDRPLHVFGHLIDHYLGCAGAPTGPWLTGGGGLTADWQEASARLPRLFSLGYGVAEDEGVDERDYFARSLAIYCLDRGRLNVMDPQIEKWFRSVLWNESLWRRTLDFMGGTNA